MFENAFRKLMESPDFERFLRDLDSEEMDAEVDELFRALLSPEKIRQF